MRDLATPSAFDLSRDASPAGLMPLSVRDLTLTLGSARVLQDVCLALDSQGCTMILGPNGAGKSVLLKLLHGLLPPTNGEILWAGKAPQYVMERQALVFQKPVLLRRSVAQNIDFVLKARGKSRSRRDALLDHVGLMHKANQPARLLSGGEAQRLAMARALATDPDVLFLDEPTANLDPGSILAIEAIVADAVSRGVKVVFVTHDVAQARRLAEDVVFLHRGRVAAHQRSDAFFSAPASRAAQDFLAGRVVV